MAPRVLLVDDEPSFLEAAARLLEREEIDIVGAAASVADGERQVARLKPDVVLIDVNLGADSGFDLARRLAATQAPPAMIAMSTHAAADFADLVAVTPLLGFLPKSELSAQAVRDLYEDRTHGVGCRHEMLVYSTPDELVARAKPFLDHGLDAGDDILVVAHGGGYDLWRDVLADAGSKVQFADGTEWYRTEGHALEAYDRYLRDRLAEGARRVRVVADVVPPKSSDDWRRYEAKVSVALAAVPVSFICTYDTRALADDLIADAARTHPLVRGSEGARPSPVYEAPGGIFAGHR